MDILVEVERHDSLEAAAQMLLDGQDPSASMRFYANLPANQLLPFTIDVNAGAVAIGDAGDSIPGSLDDLDPKNSNAFLVRAFIRANSVEEIKERLGSRIFYTDPPIVGLLTCGHSQYLGNTAKVRDELQTDRLKNRGLDGSKVAVAIVDTGIYLKRIKRRLGKLQDEISPYTDPSNSWTPPGLRTTAFDHRVGHGTMCAYDALIAAPEATLLDIAMLLFRPAGDHSVPSTIFAAFAAYSFLVQRWNSWLKLGTNAPYQALVVNNSWGIFHPFLDPFAPSDPHRYIDNPNHYFRKKFIIPLTNKGVDILFASNNCGADCASATCLGNKQGTIMGANAYEEVLTVGGCDVNRSRVGYSSQGPSIYNMPPNKPDILAFTHFLGSNIRSTWLPDNGVSAACAVASGCVAALRSDLLPSNVGPPALFDALRSTADKGVGSGTNGGVWNADYGCGIINPVKAGNQLGMNIP